MSPIIASWGWASRSIPSHEKRPFDPAHPIYQPVPANPSLASYSATVAANITQQIGLDTGGDSPPVYIGTATDPLWQATIQGTIFSFRAPEGIVAGTGSDYPMVVLDKANAQFNGFPVEFRMWQATPNTSTHVITNSNGGVGIYNNDGARRAGNRARGQAEIHGSNTGSGCSYTVGMVRPHEIAQGRIDHAIRVAALYSASDFVWPAIVSDGTGLRPDAPMGSRIFLDRSVALGPLNTLIDGEIPSSNPKGRAGAKTLLKAIQEFGFCVLDSGGGGHNIYMEGSGTADWTSALGPADPTFLTWNFIGRAIKDVIPWDQMRVLNPSVLDQVGR